VKIPPLRVAILDLYDNTPNQGMRAIKEMLAACDGRFCGRPITYDVFETRHTGAAPSLAYDAYVSTGGPGSPFDGAGKAWEDAYFGWLDAVWTFNQRATPEARKHVLFICHSFQMMCRFFELAQVTERRSPSFGIFPVHKTPAGVAEPLFAGLGDPFYAADFRSWQVVQPDAGRLRALGAEILALEKIRPHVRLERAIMAIRLSPELIGVQFHPEADPPGMTVHFRQAERKDFVVAHHGEEKYYRILHRMEDPAYLKQTHDTILPCFLERAVAARNPDRLSGEAA
jgi:homoserine O-succinyltransferase